GFIEVFRDGVRLEERMLLVDAQDRYFRMRRDREEPVGAMVPIDVRDVVRNLLCAQHDRRALDPRARLEAAQHVFGAHASSDEWVERAAQCRTISANARRASWAARSSGGAGPRT